MNLISIKDFFDNLNVFFQEENEGTADALCSFYKSEEGTIKEIRIFNPDYDEFMIIKRDGEVQCIGVEEEDFKPKKLKR